ncbi:MAG: ComF family protein [Gammaproteobacteria bacterium]
MEAWVKESCGLCGADLHPPARVLCTGCFEDLPRAGPHCDRCGADLAGADTCGECLRRTPPIDHCLVALDYRYPVDRLIWNLKFRRRMALCVPLARCMEDRFRATATPLPDLLIGVPMHRWRMAARGFNQSQELARLLGVALGIDADPRALEKTRHTPAQASLGAGARRANLQGAFKVLRCVRGRRIAIIDDVLTTGSTVAEMARMLRAAGAVQVQAWVCCRVEPGR